MKMAVTQATYVLMGWGEEEEITIPMDSLGQGGNGGTLETNQSIVCTTPHCSGDRIIQTQRRGSRKSRYVCCTCGASYRLVGIPDKPIIRIGHHMYQVERK
jgi:hypothetical protein